MAEIRLSVPGPPRPAGRPRFARIGRGVRTYPHPDDGPAKLAIQAAWARAGRPRIIGPWHALIEVVVPRPKSHFCQRGLSAAGKRAKAPPGDCDNFAKLGLDALVQAEAVPDDRYCLSLTVSKRWGDLGDPGSLYLEVWPQ